MQHLERCIHFGAVLVLICSTVVNGQTENQKTLTKGTTPGANVPLVTGNPTANIPFYFPSPLSSSFDVMSYGNQLNAVGNNGLELQTKTINIAPAVAAYAREKNLDLDQARLQSLEYLGLVRMKDIANQVEDPLQPQVKLLSADRFEVTAPQFYFASLPGLIRSLELGKKTVLVECQIWALDETIQQEARKFLRADSIHHVGGQIPQTQIEDPALRTKAGPYEVASTMKTVTAAPTTIGQLDQDNFERLMRLVDSRQDCQVVNSPSVTMLPGQDASVQDGAQRPFVVGIEKMKGDFTATYQPLIQSLEDGNFFKVNCVPVENDIELNCTLAFAKVISVGTIDLERDAATDSSVTVQTPTQQVREINVATTLPEGRVLFIDPHHQQTTTIKGKNGRESTQVHNLVAVIRARVIADE